MKFAYRFTFILLQLCVAAASVYIAELMTKAKSFFYRTGSGGVTCGDEDVLPQFQVRSFAIFFVLAGFYLVVFLVNGYFTSYAAQFFGHRIVTKCTGIRLKDFSQKRGGAAKKASRNQAASTGSTAAQEYDDDFSYGKLGVVFPVVFGIWNNDSREAFGMNCRADFFLPLVRPQEFEAKDIPYFSPNIKSLLFDNWGEELKGNWREELKQLLKAESITNPWQQLTVCLVHGTPEDQKRAPIRLMRPDYSDKTPEADQYRWDFVTALKEYVDKRHRGDNENLAKLEVWETIMRHDFKYKSRIRKNLQEAAAQTVSVLCQFFPGGAILGKFSEYMNHPCTWELQPVKELTILSKLLDKFCWMSMMAKYGMMLSLLLVPMNDEEMARRFEGLLISIGAYAVLHSLFEVNEMWEEKFTWESFREGSKTQRLLKGFREGTEVAQESALKSTDEQKHELMKEAEDKQQAAQEAAAKAESDKVSAEAGRDAADEAATDAEKDRIAAEKAAAEAAAKAAADEAAAEAAVKEAERLQALATGEGADAAAADAAAKEAERLRLVSDEASAEAARTQVAAGKAATEEAEKLRVAAEEAEKARTAVAEAAAAKERVEVADAEAAVMEQAAAAAAVAAEEFYEGEVSEDDEGDKKKHKQGEGTQDAGGGVGPLGAASSSSADGSGRIRAGEGIDLDCFEVAVGIEELPGYSDALPVAIQGEEAGPQPSSGSCCSCMMCVDSKAMAGTVAVPPASVIGNGSVLVV